MKPSLTLPPAFPFIGVEVQRCTSDQQFIEEGCSQKVYNRKLLTQTPMRYLILVLLIWGLQSLCMAQQTLTDTIFHDSVQRTFILYVPASYSGSDSVPLIFSFHGFGGNAEDQMADYDFRPIADTAGFLVAYPQGLATGPGVSTWNIGSSGTDDIGFTAAMIDAISAMFPVNRDRVYATGMSMGGFFSIHLAGRLSEQIAAIASVSGTMTQGTLGASAPVHPTPFLQIHGTTDPLVPYAGNPLYLSVEETLDYWIGYNQCDPPPTITQLADIDPTDGSTVEHIVYGNGDQGVTVEHLKIIGGGHAWPGGTDGRAGTNFDIDASEEIWKFFSRYDINGLIGGAVNIETMEEQLSGTLTRAYPNPFSTQTTIRFTLEQPGNASLKIYDLTGRHITTLLDGQQAPGEHSLIWDGTDTQGNAMPSGTYFYRLETKHLQEAKSMMLLR